MDPAEAYLVTSALEGAAARGTGRGLGDLAEWGGLAGKSGTSNDWRDAWFVAYTPSLAVGVWVGYDDGRSLRLPGARAALPIVARFLHAVLEDQRPEPFSMPEGVELARISSGTTDGWVDWGCDGQPEVFLRGTAPRNGCRSFEFMERWGRGMDHRTEKLLELLQEHGGEFVRRLAERLSEEGRRALR